MPVIKSFAGKQALWIALGRPVKALSREVQQAAFHRLTVLLRASFWLGLQERYDLLLAERALAPVLATITLLPRPPLMAE